MMMIIIIIIIIKQQLKQIKSKENKLTHMQCSTAVIHC